MQLGPTKKEVRISGDIFKDTQPMAFPEAGR